MTRKVRWGIVSTANIGMTKVTPAIMKSAHSEVVALASRDLEKAHYALRALGLNNAKAHGSYEALFADPDVDAVYNALPNHLHIPTTLAAAKAGKHVLCEKPIAITSGEAEALRKIPSHILIAEAFMVRHHPQWQRAREIVRSGELGAVHLVRGAFFYFNDDPGNIRNLVDVGGGAIFDIGCYCVLAARYIFDAEPLRVIALVDRDPRFRTDRLASVVGDFGDGRQLSFVCGTQSSGRQTVEIHGSRASLEIVIPFNAPVDQVTELLIDTGTLGRKECRRETLPPTDQYATQAEAFALAVLGERLLPFGVHDAISQMRVLDAIFRSERSAGWESVR
jgi:predicted dehydrogenase